MFIEPTARRARARSSPTRSCCTRPTVEADPEEDGTRTGTFVVLHPTRSEVLIGGTFYAGEIKKAIFTVMNDRLPLEGVLPMHCSANVGEDGRVAIFFGLSGTGKTTLSADPERSLIGDDEHGWGDSGVFNIEGGCYAKVIRLSAEAEPEIFRTTRTFGTILENVVVDERGVLDLDDDSKTENTRAAYKLERIANALPTKQGGPPERRRLPHRGRVRDPAADRAAHARPGDVLLPLRLHGEARRHGDRRHRAAADLLDLLRRAVPAAAARRLRADARREARRARRRASGSSTPAGRAARSATATGCRSRPRARLLHAALSGELDGVEYRIDPVFGFEVPVAVPGRRQRAARPALDLARPGRVRREGAASSRGCSAANFEKFAADAGAAVAAAGPRG